MVNSNTDSKSESFDDPPENLTHSFSRVAALTKLAR